MLCVYFYFFNIFHYFLICLIQYRQRVIFASANIYPFVWSVWSEPDILPYAFDTSEAWVFCRGCQIRNPLEDSTDKRFYSLVEYTPFRWYGANPTFCLTLSIPRKRRYFVVVSECAAIRARLFAVA